YAVPDEFVPTISKLERERRCASTGYLTSPIAARQLFPATIESARGFSIGSIAFVLVFGSLTSTVPADENSPSFVVSAAIRQKYLPDGKSVSSYVVPLTTRSNTMSAKALSRANCKRYRVTPGRGPQCKLTSCVCAFAESCLDKGGPANASCNRSGIDAARTVAAIVRNSIRTWPERYIPHHY